MTQHTPGPWGYYAEGLRGGRYFIVTRGSSAEEIDLREDENGEADARLIAAAPDLLKALKDARSMLAAVSLDEPDDDYQASWDRGLARVDAALAKAEDAA